MPVGIELVLASLLINFALFHCVLKKGQRTLDGLEQGDIVLEVSIKEVRKEIRAQDVERAILSNSFQEISWLRTTGGIHQG